MVDIYGFIPIIIGMNSHLSQIDYYRKDESYIRKDFSQFLQYVLQSDKTTRTPSLLKNYNADLYRVLSEKYGQEWDIDWLEWVKVHDLYADKLLGVLYGWKAWRDGRYIDREDNLNKELVEKDLEFFAYYLKNTWYKSWSAWTLRKYNWTLYKAVAFYYKSMWKEQIDWEEIQNKYVKKTWVLLEWSKEYNDIDWWLKACFKDLYNKKSKSRNPTSIKKFDYELYREILANYPKVANKIDRETLWYTYNTKDLGLLYGGIVYQENKQIDHKKVDRALQAFFAYLRNIQQKERQVLDLMRYSSPLYSAVLTMYGKTLDRKTIAQKYDKETTYQRRTKINSTWLTVEQGLSEFFSNIQMSKTIWSIADLKTYDWKLYAALCDKGKFNWREIQKKYAREYPVLFSGIQYVTQENRVTVACNMLNIEYGLKKFFMYLHHNRITTWNPRLLRLFNEQLYRATLDAYRNKDTKEMVWTSVQAINPYKDIVFTHLRGNWESKKIGTKATISQQIDKAEEMYDIQGELLKFVNHILSQKQFSWTPTQLKEYNPKLYEAIKKKHKGHYGKMMRKSIHVEYMHNSWLYFGNELYEIINNWTKIINIQIIKEWLHNFFEYLQKNNLTFRYPQMLQKYNFRLYYTIVKYAKNQDGSANRPMIEKEYNNWLYPAVLKSYVWNRLTDTYIAYQLNDLLEKRKTSKKLYRTPNYIIENNKSLYGALQFRYWWSWIDRVAILVTIVKNTELISKFKNIRIDLKHTTKRKEIDFSNRGLVDTDAIDPLTLLVSKEEESKIDHQRALVHQAIWKLDKKSQNLIQLFLDWKIIDSKKVASIIEKLKDLITKQ